jgi:hypothetical protein
MVLAACAKGAIANSAQSTNLLMVFTECEAGSEHSRPFLRGREGDAGIAGTRRMRDATAPHQERKIRDFLLRIFRILLAMNSSFPL